MIGFIQNLYLIKHHYPAVAHEKLKIDFKFIKNIVFRIIQAQYFIILMFFSQENTVNTWNPAVIPA